MKFGCCAPPPVEYIKPTCDESLNAEAALALEAGICFVSVPPYGFSEEYEARPIHTPTSISQGSGSARGVRMATEEVVIDVDTQNHVFRSLRVSKEPLEHPSSGATSGGNDACDSPSVPAGSLPSWSLRSGYLFRSLRIDELDLVPELTSFEGCEDLLRAAPLTTVLDGQGRVFSRSAGSAETFAMSSQVDNIDTFISHNWDIPRWIKFLALSHHFTFTTASISCLLFWVIIGVLQAHGLLPTILDQSFEYEVGFICRFLHLPVFTVTLFFAQDVKKCLGYHGPKVFLDKLCIHQVDNHLQQRGIAKLSAFLCNSDEMLSLYTNIYLEKLWTVFEVASFLALRPVENMQVLPLDLVRFYYIGLLFAWLAAWTPIVLHYFFSFAGFEAVLWTAMFGGFVMYVARLWAHSRRDVYERLQKFSVKNCRCTVEPDRQLVCRNIAVLMRSKMATPGASDEEALQLFDELVRQELPHVFSASLATISVPWHQVVVWSFLWQGSYIVDVNCAMYAQGAHMQEAFITAIPRAFWILLGIPLLFAIMEWIASKKKHLRGVRDVLYVMPSFWLLVGLPGYVADVILRTFADQVNVVGCCVCGAVCLITGPLVWLVFSRGRQRRATNAPEKHEPLPEEYANYNKQIIHHFSGGSNNSIGSAAAKASSSDRSGRGGGVGVLHSVGSSQQGAIPPPRSHASPGLGHTYSIGAASTQSPQGSPGSSKSPKSQGQSARKVGENGENRVLTDVVERSDEARKAKEKEEKKEEQEESTEEENQVDRPKVEENEKEEEESESNADKEAAEEAEEDRELSKAVTTIDSKASI